VVLLAVAALATACGPGKTAGTAASTPQSPWVAGVGGSITVGIDQAPTGCNPNSATGDTWADQLVLEPVLPSSFVVSPGDAATYDSAVIEQAEVVDTTPQTVVYTLNPKAVWSDGVPITASDFVYAWQEQRGTATATTGASALDVATTEGYRQIKSVVGSHDGRTVTVVFDQPFADWKMLFNDLLPAHVMEKAGWDPMCTGIDPAVDLSGGPFEVGQVVPGHEVVLVRNPRWWGQAPYLERITVRTASGPAQLTHWLLDGTVQVIEPGSFGRSFLQQMTEGPSIDSSDTVSTTFLQLEYSTTSALTGDLDVREALSHAIDRQALVDDVVGWANTSIVPSASHLYSQVQTTYPGPKTPSVQLEGQPGTTTTTAPLPPTPSRPFPLTADPDEVARLLVAAGFVHNPAGTWLLPNGKPMVVRLGVDDADRWASAAATVVVHQLAAVDIPVTRVTAPDAQSAGQELAAGAVDAALLPFDATPYPTEAIAWYTPLLGAPGVGGSEDWSDLSDPALDSVLTQASENLNPIDAATLYSQADAMLWQQMVALPLFAEPVAVAWSTSIAGVGPNPSGPGLLWYPQTWSIKVPPNSPDTVPAT
jgi:peptide/nickel transport system substrate-binding protein